MSVTDEDRETSEELRQGHVTRTMMNAAMETTRRKVTNCSNIV